MPIHTIFRRELFGKEPIYNYKNKYAEDFETWVKAITLNKKLLHIDKALTYYSLENTKRKTTNNAKAQIKIRLRYCLILSKIIIALFTGALINIVRIFVPFHHYSLSNLFNKKKGR